jgi:hypothetical protein
VSVWRWFGAVSSGGWQGGGALVVDFSCVDLSLVIVPEELRVKLGTKKDECAISFPYQLKHHKHATSTRFEEMAGEAVVLWCWWRSCSRGSFRDPTCSSGTASTRRG